LNGTNVTCGINALMHPDATLSGLRILAVSYPT
jgi:hypothetical protein